MRTVSCNLFVLFFKANLIRESTAKSLQARGSQTPQMYGRPKVHKENVPLRPIVSMVNSPQHKLAKWLAEMINLVRDAIGKYTLKDSYQMCQLMNDLNIKNEHLFTMDVNSLFTNVPLSETIDVICNTINKYDLDIPLPNSELSRLLLLRTSNIKFKFLGQGYRQIDGVAMGSPLGPILADIFVAHLEQNLQKFISKTTLYRRYVDDILVITNNQKEGENLFRQLNNMHPHITLTKHEEENNSIAFLDIVISRREDGSVRRSVYRKNTWSGQYLHFTSFAPMKYKIGLVRTLFHRAREICTTDTLEEERKVIVKTLSENGYPLSFVSKHCQQKSKEDPIPNVPKMSAFLRLPYKGDDVTNLINKRLNSAINRTYYAAKQIIISTTTRIQIPSVKEPQPLHAKSNCIYQFTCECSATYIGRTERQLHNRMVEHIPVWLQKSMKDKFKAITSPEKDRTLKSSITQHICESKHCVIPQKAFNVVYTTNNNRALRYAEALVIRNRQPQLCKQREWLITLALPW